MTQCKICGKEIHDREQFKTCFVTYIDQVKLKRRERGYE